MKKTGKRERLQKLIAAAGLESRRNAEEWIRDGLVEVNGVVASLGDSADLACDEVVVKGRRLQPATLERRTILLAMNKPRGVISSHDDPHHDQTVVDLLPPRYHGERWIIAGRLDKESEGLLLLTNDGDLAQQIAHPSQGLVKRYRVTVHRPFEERHGARLVQGMEVEGEWLRAERVIPARRGPQADRRVEIHLTEGRKREIRRMLEAFGYYVKRLRRYQIGGYVLRGLGPGMVRELNAADRRRLFQDPSSGGDGTRRAAPRSRTDRHRRAK